MQYPTPPSSQRTLMVLRLRWTASHYPKACSLASLNYYSNSVRYNKKVQQIIQQNTTYNTGNIKYTATSVLMMPLIVFPGNTVFVLQNVCVQKVKQGREQD